MKVAILGSRGQLGQAFNFVAKKFPEVELIPCRLDLDIAFTAQWVEYLDECKPDVVINCIAYNQVDLAESNTDRACLVNGLALEPLAAWAANNQIFWVQFSSDYVFDGDTQVPYTEEDRPNPLGVYGYSKRIMENIFLFYNPPGLLIRTSWIFSLFGVNVLTRFLAKARSSKQISMVDDLIGSPTRAEDLAEMVLELILKADNSSMELLHLSNSGEASWFEVAKEVNRLWDLDLVIQRQSFSDFSKAAALEKDALIASRPSYSVLNLSKAEAKLGRPIRDWRLALEDLAVGRAAE